MIATKVGRAGWGDHHFRGRMVYADLLGRTSLARLLALCFDVELSADAGEFFDEVFVSCLLPDPHIWPLKLGRVATAYGGSTMTGVCAGLLAFEGGTTGAGPAQEFGRILVDITALDPSASDDAIQALFGGGRRVPGFGVPARAVDERVVALAGCVAARGRTSKAYWKMWLRIVEHARLRRIEPNIDSALAAVLLDLGFAPTQLEALTSLVLMFCLLPNVIEGEEQQPAILRELPEQVLTYCGPSRRLSGRARAAVGEE